MSSGLDFLQRWATTWKYKMVTNALPPKVAFGHGVRHSHREARTAVVTVFTAATEEKLEERPLEICCKAVGVSPNTSVITIKTLFANDMLALLRKRDGQL